MNMLFTGFLKEAGEIATIDETKKLNVASQGSGSSLRKDTVLVKDPLSANKIRKAAFRQCPKCGQPSLVREEGCDNCRSCTYSKCG